MRRQLSFLSNAHRARRRRPAQTWPAGALALLTLVLAIAGATRLTAGDPHRTAPATEPAPLSPQERAAVALALDYLQGGAASWQRQLAPASPWSKLSAADAIAEIAARVGPADGARWQLQRSGPSAHGDAAVLSIEYPSGMDEMLWLEVEPQGAGWQLRSLRSLSEPWPAPTGSAPDFERIAAAAPRGSGAPLAPSLLLALGLGAAAVLATTRRRAGAAALALAVAATAWACHRGEAPVTAAGEVAELRALAPLRAALARGAGGEELQRLIAAAPRDGAAGEVARLWRGDRMLRDLRLNEADAALTGFADRTPYPLAELLRARLAVVRGDATDAFEHYERLRELGADVDALRLEAAVALATNDQEKTAERAFDRLAALGSRLAAPYYIAAESALADNHAEEAEAAFALAWRLQPISRQRLFDSPLLATVCTRQTIFPLLHFGSVEEPLVGPPIPGGEPVAPPPGATATLSGELLRYAVGTAELRVPGGANLAPANATLDTPVAFERRERDLQVAELPQLLQQAATPGAFAQPALRRRLELAAAGLAEHERWSDLLSLTDGLTQYDGRLPPDLTQLRAAALVHSKRPADAFALLLRLAQDDKLHGRHDTGTLYQLADVLRREQRYDLAIKVLHRANELSGLAAGRERERQLLLEKGLAESHQQLDTRWFHIRYPRLTGEQYAQQLAVVLDAERQRMARWIPVQNPQPVDVDLYPVREFLASYAAEMPVVGIFDGRVRVPFADLRSLHPQLVAILSHELAHALITQATGDHAPRWVQEGLAQHVQMVQDVSNPYPDLARAGHELALPVVEQALGGFSEPQFVELSYAEAAWTFHYLEARHGVVAIHRLLGAYAAGADDQGALRSALGMDQVQLDRSLREWATTSAPAVWPVTLRRYDEEAEQLLLRHGGEAPPVRVTARGGDFRDRREDEAAAMRKWYAQYRELAAPVKSAYAPVLAALAAPHGAPDVLACQRLANEAAQALVTPERFQAPDELVAVPLRAAFRSLRELGRACSHGDVAAARDESQRVQQYLGQAATVLGRYGIQP